MRITGEFAYDREDIRCLVGDIVDLLSGVVGTLDIARDHVFGHTFEFLSSESDDALLFVVVFLYVLAHKTIIMEEIGWKTVH